MKNIIKILFVTLLACSLFDFDIGAQDFTIEKDQQLINYTGVAADTGQGTTAWTKTIYIDESADILENGWYKYAFEVDVDSSGDGTDVTCALYASDWNSSTITDWTSLGSITWGVTSPDTTLKWTNIGTDQTITTSNAAHTEIHSGTSTLAAYYMIAADTAGFKYYFPDSTAVGAQTTTFTDTTTVAAQSITTTMSYGARHEYYLKLVFTGGGSGARFEVQAIRAKFLPFLKP